MSQLPNLARLLSVVVPKPLPTATHTTKLQPMPSLVLQHAGIHCQWLCHGSGNSQKDPYLSDYDIRYYLCHLLVALDALHLHGIMHRVVKPRNVLVNHGDNNNNDNPLMLIGVCQIRDTMCGWLPDTTRVPNCSLGTSTMTTQSTCGALVVY